MECETVVGVLQGSVGEASSMDPSSPTNFSNPMYGSLPGQFAQVKTVKSDLGVFGRKCSILLRIVRTVFWRKGSLG